MRRVGEGRATERVALAPCPRLGKLGRSGGRGEDEVETPVRPQHTPAPCLWGWHSPSDE